MNISYLSKNYKITSNFKEVLEHKLSKFERYFIKNYDVKVVCSIEGKNEKLEITINADGLFLRGEVISDEMYNNIDLVLPKLERQIVKGARRYKDKFNRGEAKMEYITEEPADIKESVVKTKRFELDPLTVEDAEAQMEALGHTFFIFLNAATGLVSVLYKRNDTNLGLIEITF